MNRIISREFPHSTIHEGAMLGNSWLGLYVWGENRTLKISVGNTNLWDHRGGMSWSPKHNYRDIRKALENNDESTIRKMFCTDTETVKGQPACPSVIPLGRIEITLASTAQLIRTEIFLSDGLVKAVYTLSDGQEYAAEIRLDMVDKGSFACRCPHLESFRIISSYELAGNTLPSISFCPPVLLDNDTIHGFMQLMPADDPFALCAARQDDMLMCRYHRSSSSDELCQFMKDNTKACWELLLQNNRKWWTKFWQTIPEIVLDNPMLEENYYECLARFGMMTDTNGIPAGLQGPWIEDSALPPWSADYHFNINVQLCYSPACRANLTANLKPLFAMIWSWKDQMRDNARMFVGIDDGFMISHAVDDRGTCMGTFWPGTIDLACGAWIAQMMFDYFDYSNDIAFLRDVAFQFMKGVFNVIYSVLEWKEGKLILPLSISPEYRDNQMDAWGANASFQLAAIHRLIINLTTAAEYLKEKTDTRWKEVADFLPQASLAETQKETELALWDGLVLEYSHRHHSHLAGIWPFDTIDPDDPEWSDIIDNSYRRWIDKGMGEWTGWCMPWASILHSRANHPQAAETIIELWNRFFRNPGGGSQHDPYVPGISSMGFYRGHSREHIMQMDGSMGIVTAIQEMLMHSRKGTLHIFPGIPAYWKKTSFQNMPAPGGFIVSASRQNDRLKIIVTATRPNTLKLAIHDNHPLLAECDGKNIMPVNGIFTCSLDRGKSIIING